MWWLTMLEIGGGILGVLLASAAAPTLADARAHADGVVNAAIAKLVVAGAGLMLLWKLFE